VGWRRAGRITLEEFRRDHWIPPPPDNFSQDGMNARDAKAITTQDWVGKKIAEGDLDGGMAAMHTGTSIFDPVICEIAYRWFCPPGGLVLDPFAGGSVRGVIASRLGRRYLGVELRGEQIEANHAQLELAGTPAPEWRQGDSRELADIAADVAGADLIFTCPPYWNLELYSHDPADLSNMKWQDFLEAYGIIIQAAADKLLEDRFAVWVVGDVRDGEGFYVGLPAHTTLAFERAGLRLYNDAILVTSCGSLPIRIRKQFEGSRKLGRTHQNILVYIKGDPKRATTACGAVEFGSLEEAALAGAFASVEGEGDGGQQAVQTAAPAPAADLGGEV
jgi:hypothetical protein